MRIRSTNLSNGAIMVLLLVLCSQGSTSAIRWTVRGDDGLSDSTSIASSSELHTSGDPDDTTARDGSLLSSIIEVQAASAPHHPPIVIPQALSPAFLSDDSLPSLRIEIQSSSPRHATIPFTSSEASLLPSIDVAEVQSSSPRPRHAPISVASSDGSSLSSTTVTELSRGPVSPPIIINSVAPSAPAGDSVQAQRIRLRGSPLLPFEIELTRPLGPTSTPTAQSTTTSDDFSIRGRTRAPAPKQHPGFRQETESAAQVTPLELLLHSFE